MIWLVMWGCDVSGWYSMGDGRQKYIPTGSGAQCPRATIVVVVAVTVVATAGSVGRGR